MNKKAVAVAACSAALAAAITGFLFASQPKGRDAKLLNKAARNVGTSPDNLSKTAGLVDSIRKNDGAVSDTDWEHLVSQVESDNNGLRSIALTAMAQLNPDSRHKDDALAYARSFMAEGHTEGTIPAILVLRKFGDPAWRTHAEALAKSPNSSTAEAAQNVLDKSTE